MIALFVWTAGDLVSAILAAGFMIWMLLEIIRDSFRKAGNWWRKIK